ncbi:hypothetical protein FSP39_007567 [Pinctada imbricata]|uniref:COR domain-containing protein n=1 Tax=Pinctada imbricata TaxID=66713 RepID=A0AA89C7Y1_PINIB|nr:hypothetical protein FSP39_007567 [Pinctada imbricata]
MTERTRETLRKVILEEGTRYKEFGERVPASWIALEEALQNAKNQQHYIISFEDVQKINKGLKRPLDEKELKICLKFFHNMGCILYFDLVPLRDFITLDPKVVMDAMRWLVVSSGQTSNDHMTRVQKSSLLKLFRKLKINGQSLNQKHVDYLLSMMQKFDLICEPMIYKKGQQMSPTFYLVPCMMKADMPNDPIQHFQGPHGDQFTFSSDTIIPPAIFNRLVCSCLAFWEVFDGHFYNGLVVLEAEDFIL